MDKTVAVIPARGGSKGIPGKNLVPLLGKPLIAWSIEQAKDAQCIDSVWVSSDSQEILKVAEHYGAKGILRPTEIAHDTASSESAWLHALDEIERLGHHPVHMIGIQATSPIRASVDFDLAMATFKREACDTLFTAMEMEDFLVWRIDPEDGYVPVNYDYKNRQMRQQIEKRFLENGSFYIMDTKILRSQQNRLGGKIGIYAMEKYKMFQIDTREDIKLCEVVMQGYNLVGDCVLSG